MQKLTPQYQLTRHTPAGSYPIAEFQEHIEAARIAVSLASVNHDHGYTVTRMDSGKVTYDTRGS